MLLLYSIYFFGNKNISFGPTIIIAVERAKNMTERQLKKNEF